MTIIVIWWRSLQNLLNIIIFFKTITVRTLTIFVQRKHTWGIISGVTKWTYDCAKILAHIMWFLMHCREVAWSNPDIWFSMFHEDLLTVCTKNYIWSSPFVFTLAFAVNSLSILIFFASCPSSLMIDHSFSFLWGFTLYKLFLNYMEFI